MDAGVWFHTTHTYGNALQVLRASIDQDRTRIPHVIIKIGWNSLDEMEEVIHQNIAPLGLETIDLGQLCWAGRLLMILPGEEDATKRFPG